jgi:hypothetical protein
MPLSLPKGVLFAYSLGEGHTATIAVLSGGPVDYSGPTAGGFGDLIGSIEAGDSVGVEAPGMLRAQATASVEITQSMPAVPEADEGTDG